MLVDRRNTAPRSILSIPRSSLFDLQPTDTPMDVDQENVDPDKAEETANLLSRWRFDQDDTPAVGPLGPEEQDRILVDDYASKYVLVSPDGPNTTYLFLAIDTCDIQ
jgi:enhancer of polycomb-like protein